MNAALSVVSAGKRDFDCNAWLAI